MKKKYKATIALAISVAGAAGTAGLAKAGFWGGMLHNGFLAATIGGMADWFAVTALFRKPLGISYRTEIIIRNRQRIMQAVVDFAGNDLLGADNVMKFVRQQDTAVFMKEFLVKNGEAMLLPVVDRMALQLQQGLSPKVLAVGISQRTREDSIDTLAETILSYDGTFQKVLAFNIPKTRSFMHLDTVFTMVDRDKFTVHPNILGQLTVFVMELDENRKMTIRQEDGRLEDILKEHLGLDSVTLIPCGRGSEIDAAREQWNDGSNTLAIAPGEVVVYARNYVTNQSLEEAGIRIHTIPSAELSRGRGGPRCMSMPLWREDL